MDYFTVFWKTILFYVIIIVLVINIVQNQKIRKLRKNIFDRLSPPYFEGSKCQKIKVGKGGTIDYLSGSSGTSK